MNNQTPSSKNQREALLCAALRTGFSYAPAAFCAAVALAGSLSAQSISVNFGSEQANSAVTEAAKLTGAVPVAGNFWNNTTTASGTLTNLVSSTGAATTASVTWASPNTYFSASTGFTATSENGDLTKGYLDDSSGWTVDFVSPYLLNDIYIIHATDQGASANMSAVRVNGSFYKGNGAGGTVPATSNDSWTASNWSNLDTLVESTNYIKVLGQPAVSVAGLAATPGRAALAGLQVVNGYAGTLAYWDTNGATAGFGGSLDGTWGTSAFWTGSAAGDTATTAWTAGRAAVFSAPTVNDSFTVSVNGTQAADAIWLKQGLQTLSGGTINLSGGLGLVRVDGSSQLTFASQLNAANLTTAGTIYLQNAANNITGLFTVSSGTTSLDVAHSFAQIAGGGTLDLYGGALTVGSTNLNSTFNGSITGSGFGIIKTGTGSLTLGSGAGVGGPTEGGLAINGGSVIFDTRISGPVVLSRTLTGSGSLQLVGSGALPASDITVDGPNGGFSGGITVNGARLIVPFIGEAPVSDVLGTTPVTVLSTGQIYPGAGVVVANNLTLTGLGPTEPAGQLGALRLEGNSSVSGNITLQGTTRVGVVNGSTGSISGAITGDAASILEKAGNGVLTIESTGNSGFLGKTRIDGTGTLQIASQTSLGNTPASATADSITIAGGSFLRGGTVAGGADVTLDANRGITIASGNSGFNTLAGFTTTVNGPVAGAGNLTFAGGTGTTVINGNVALNTTTGSISVNSGTATFNGASVAAYGLIGYTATTNLASANATFASMNLGAGGGNAHTVNQTAGSTTATSQFLLGHWANNTSVYNISGGSLNLPETTSATAENQANLFLGIDGTGVLNISGTGVVNTSSLVVNGRSEGHNTDGANPQADTVNLTGGRLNLGKWGMRTMGSTYAVNLGDGVLGAWADWSSSLNMALTGNTVVNTLDSVNGTTPRTITLTGVLSGSGSLDKQGAGTLVLDNAGSNFTGVAKVSGGSLNVINSGAATTVQAAAGGTVRVGPFATPGTGTASTLDLNGGTAAFRIGTTTDLLTVTNLNISAPSTIAVTPTGPITGPFPATFPVLDYTNITGSPASLAFVPANPHLSGTLVNDTVNTRLVAQITAADSLVWKGNVDGAWNVNSTANWVLASNGTTPSNFYDFDVVSFTDAGLTRPTVTLAGTIQTASVEVSNTTGTYTFQGTGITSGSLSKTGAGALVLLNNNTYTGATSITGGSVTVGNGSTTGTLGGSGNITLSNATLTLNRSDAQTLSRTIAGTAGTLVKNGGGTLTMTAAGHTADIVVNAGTLAARGGGFSNSFAPGKTITVNAGAVLDTVTHSLGSAVGGGGAVPTVTLNSASWVLNNEQYGQAVNLTASTISGPGDLRVVGGSVYTVNAAATSSTIAAPLNLTNGLSLVVNDGAAANDLVVSGGIFSAQTLTKSGAGVAVLTGANTNTGAITISAGTLQVGNGGTTGTLAAGTAAVTNNATLAFNRSDNLSVPNAIGGTGVLTKAGAGILTLGGVNTYTGNTSITAGTVQLADNAQLKFAPGANGVSNKITGSGSVELLGDFVIDLTGANLTNGNSWTLVDVGPLTETYLSTFTVAGFTETANVHKLVDGQNTWTFTESTGVLTLTIGSDPYGAFESTYGIVGAGPDVDSDGDGIDNGIEFVLGTDPSGPNDAASLPSFTVDPLDPAYMLVSFNVTDASKNNNPRFEYSTTLQEGSWSDGLVNGVTRQVTEIEEGVLERWTYRIQKSVAAPGGKFFGRIKVDIPAAP